MNEENFTLYKTFKNQSDIKSLLVQLNSFDIQHKIESVNTNLIPYLQSSTGDEEGLFIKTNDISKLEQMLIQVYQNYPFEEHPFFLMDHSELQNIIVSPQEWGIDNVFFAKKIIAIKGNEISNEQIQQQ